MRSWNLLLDAETLLDCICPTALWEEDFDSIEALKKLVRQHRIVWSDELVELMESLYDETTVAQLQNFICCENIADFTCKVDDTTDCTSVPDWLDMASQDTLLDNDWFVICKNNRSVEAVRTRIASEKIYTEKDALEEHIDNRIRRNSTDCQVRVVTGTDCRIYAEWFQELFYGERRVTMFDPYLVNANGLSAFSSYLAPALKDKEVYIFTDAEEWSHALGRAAQWDQIARNNNLRLQIFISDTRNKSRKEHDRHVFLGSNIHVTIGRGFDFLNAATGQVRGTTIIIKQDTVTTPKTIQMEYPYTKAATFPRKNK